MPNFTKTIYLIGKHANLHKESFVKTSENFDLISISYEMSSPFESATNRIIVNDKYFDFDHDYELSALKNMFKKIISYDLSPCDSVLCIGDPSELLYQAFLLAKNEINFHNDLNNDSVNLFIYPVGMVALDIRKELSSLMYFLKKSNNPTFLIRKEEKDLRKLFSIVANTISVLSFMELADEVKGLEQLIHPKLSYLIE